MNASEAVMTVSTDGVAHVVLSSLTEIIQPEPRCASRTSNFRQGESMTHSHCRDIPPEAHTSNGECQVLYLHKRHVQIVGINSSLIKSHCETREKRDASQRESESNQSDEHVEHHWGEAGIKHKI